MQLGEFETNNIYNVDCYEAIKKLPDKSVDLVIIDPPYDIPHTNCWFQNCLIIIETHCSI